VLLAPGDVTSALAHFRSAIAARPDDADALNNLGYTLFQVGQRDEALQLYQRARENNFKILIGCMVCTSLSIAPARLLASNTDWVDLDGPLLLARDRDHGLLYRSGRIGMPARELWG